MGTIAVLALVAACLMQCLHNEGMLRKWWDWWQWASIPGILGFILAWTYVITACFAWGFWSMLGISFVGGISATVVYWVPRCVLYFMYNK